MAAPNGLSDNDREEIAAAIAAGLFLIYQAHRNETLSVIAQRDISARASLAQKQKIQRFAADRAKKIQDGINQRIANAEPDVGITQAQALQQTQSAIGDYHATTLAPFLASWATNQATVDAYEEVPADSQGQNLAGATQWEWTQNSEFLDDCMDAEDASPTGLDTLFSITGGPPPAHPNCTCSLDAVETDPDALQYALRQIDSWGPLDSGTSQAMNALQGLDVQVTTDFPGPRQIPMPPR